MDASISHSRFYLLTFPFHFNSTTNISNKTHEYNWRIQGKNEEQPIISISNNVKHQTILRNIGIYFHIDAITFISSTHTHVGRAQMLQIANTTHFVFILENQWNFFTCCQVSLNPVYICNNIPIHSFKYFNVNGILNV